MIEAMIKNPAMPIKLSVNTTKHTQMVNITDPVRRAVAESGVKTAADVRSLRAIGADAVLVGETLMRAADKTQKLNELRGI